MKLGATLLVPVIALVVVAGLEMASTAREVDEVHDQAELATVALGPPSVLIQIELERNAGSVYLLGQEDAVALSVEDNAEARANTDKSLSAFEETIRRRGGDVAQAYAPAFQALEGLDELRAEIDAFAGVRSLDNNPVARANFDGYTAIMDEIFAASAQVTPIIDQGELRRGAELADLSAHQSDTTARVIRELLRAVVEGNRDGVNRPAEVDGLARQLATLRRNAAIIDAKAEGPYRPLADELFAKEHIQRFQEVVQSALDTGRVKLGEALANSTGSESGAFGYTVFSRQVNDQLRADADEMSAAADARLLRYGLLAAAAVLLALLTTWLVSRSITRPLHALTRQAKDMASRKLPGAVGSILATPLGDDVQVPEISPVDVTTSDEVGDVAVALNTVQETALELAVEQAVLRRNIADSFVNLGRRNQNLLGRQLDFITELESTETDPDTLASLFRLDHLATRMRRNAESLLVLAGIDPPRQWAAPVRLTDVIRAALGEVEDYQRVTVRSVEAATIVGSAAADVAHLIAEFIENGLTFSPPEQSVEIRGRRQADGYTLAIVDNGLGMPPEDIARANRRLAGEESFTIAPSKYLGHYVAGNLAARHAVEVRLEQSPGGGITTTVHLPAALFTEDGPADLPMPAAALLAGASGGGPHDADGPGGPDGSGAPGWPPAAPLPLGTSPAGASGPGVSLPTLNAGYPPVPLRTAPRPGGPAAAPLLEPTALADDATTEPGGGLGGRPVPRSTTGPAPAPGGDLLDALTQHSRNLGGLDTRPATPVIPPRPGDTPALPRRTGRGGPAPVPADPTRDVAPVPPDRPGPPPAERGDPTLPRRFGSPTSPLPGDQAGGEVAPPLPRRPGAVSMTGQAAGDAGAAPAPGLPAPPDGPSIPGPAQATWAALGNLPAARPRTPLATPSPGAPDTSGPGGALGTPTAGNGLPRRPSGTAGTPGRPGNGDRVPYGPDDGGPGEPEVTPSGLVRRVPGAHLPPEGPHIIRRSTDATPPPAAPTGPVPAAAGAVPTGPLAEVVDGGDEERAESVYTLLTSFADGVQRGLDEATGDQPAIGPDERPAPGNGPEGRNS